MQLNRMMIGAALIPALSGAAIGQTTQVEPSVYRVESGVTFEIANFGASDFLFNWTDSSGSVVNEPDPTLILSAGEVYTFRRTTGSHPFVITDTTLPVSGADGAYFRDTFDGAVIDAATLQPIADFTADPAPTTDVIEWSLTGKEIGDYFYTCRVTGHAGMAGRIEIVSNQLPCAPDLTGDGSLDFFDVSFFLSNSIDYNGDTTFDFFDVSQFLQEFGIGCP